MTTGKRINHVSLEPNYHTTKCFSGNLVAIETTKTSKTKHQQGNDVLVLVWQCKTEVWR